MTFDEWEASPEPHAWENDPEFYAQHPEIHEDNPVQVGWTCGVCGQVDNQEGMCDMCGEHWEDA